MIFIALQPSINNSSLTKKSVLKQPWLQDVFIATRKGMPIGRPSHTSVKFTNPTTLYTWIADWSKHSWWNQLNFDHFIFPCMIYLFGGYTLYLINECKVRSIHTHFLQSYWSLLSYVFTSVLRVWRGEI